MNISKKPAKSLLHVLFNGMKPSEAKAHKRVVYCREGSMRQMKNKLYTHELFRDLPVF
jgi:hypothetical protein